MQYLKRQIFGSVVEFKDLENGMRLSSSRMLNCRKHLLVFFKFAHTFNQSLAYKNA